MCGSMIKQTVSDILFAKYSNAKLEQLECLRSEDTPRRLMITNIIESCWLPSQIESRKICKKLKF